MPSVEFYFHARNIFATDKAIPHGCCNDHSNQILQTDILCVCRFVYESRQQNKFLMTCPLKLYHSFGKPKNQRKEEI